jgi:UDP-N-acetylmuramoylalanine--D-glutamate ligase
MEIAGKKVLVLGLAKSGMAAILLLHKHQAQITLSETKPLDKLEHQAELEAMGVRLVCGELPKALFEEEFDFVIKNPGIKYTEWFILRLQERNIPIYTEIELAYQLAPHHHYLAVTGTNGKTTTVTLIYEILKAAFGKKAHFAGNIGVPLCEIVYEHQLETEENHYIVLEMSNFQLLNIEQFRPEVSTIINLTPDHLDYMRNLDEYYASKTNIYMNQENQNVYINNLDDQNIQDYMAKYKPHGQVVSLSMQHQADYHLEGEMIMYHDQMIMPTSDIQMVGRQNIQNVMMAIAMCETVGVKRQVIVQTVKGFPGVEHRVEFVREVNGVKYYNDSKGTNTDATIVAIQSFTCPIILLVGGKEKNLSMATLKKNLSNVKQVIGYGDCGKRLVDDLVGEMGIVVVTMDEALQEARKVAIEGDVVLLSPTTSSFDQFSSFEERGRYFKALVQKL